MAARITVTAKIVEKCGKIGAHALLLSYRKPPAPAHPRQTHSQCHNDHVTPARNQINPCVGSVRDQCVTASPEPVAHIQPLLPAHQHPVHGRLDRAHEGAMIVHPGHNGVERLSDAIRSWPPRRSASASRARLCARRLPSACTAPRPTPAHRRNTATALPGDHRLQQALRHQVGVAAVGRGRVRVVLHREAEVPLRRPRRASPARIRRDRAA